MGNRDRSTLGSDSGYGDDVASLKSLRSRCGSDAHPLTRKGYDIGPASRLQVGDVFEFLWADAAEFQWEWKCLGYTRFIVLRHSESFPHHCACIPINTGHVGKQDFAKPSIDHFQQGFVYANGDSNPGCEQPSGGIKLPYSPVAIELRPGRLRVKPDSRANYADIVNVDYEAQVMVVGDVVRYFDRVRRNVNKAFMRQILRKALEKYQEEKAKKFEEQKQTEGLKADEEQANDPGLTQLQDQTDGSVETAESIDGDLGGADCRQHEHEILSPADAQPGVKSGTQADMQAESSAEYALESIPEIVEGAAPIESAPEPEVRHDSKPESRHVPKTEPRNSPKASSGATRESKSKSRSEPRVEREADPEYLTATRTAAIRTETLDRSASIRSEDRREHRRREDRQRQATSKSHGVEKERRNRSDASRPRNESDQGPGTSSKPKNQSDYDLRSMHNVAMAGLK